MMLPNHPTHGVARKRAYLRLSESSVWTLLLTPFWLQVNTILLLQKTSLFAHFVHVGRSSKGLFRRRTGESTQISKVKVVELS
jgi:hypothetical protein